MASVNRVILVGNLGNDPDVKHSKSGLAVANLSLATTDKWQDKNTNEWQEKTEWHKIVFFDKRAEFAEKYLRKGSQIYVEGKLQTEKWTDKDGVERYTTKIIGSVLQILGKKEDNNSSNSKNSTYKVPPPPDKLPVPSKDFDEDVPF